MTFRITVKQNPLKIEFEAGSIKEAIAILTDSAASLGEAFAVAAGLNGEQPEAPTTSTVPAEPKKPRGRPRNQPDPATASAPPPLAVPTAAAPPVPTTAAGFETGSMKEAVGAAPIPPVPVVPSGPAPSTPGLEIPAFLARNPDNTLPGVPAAPLPAPPPPPVPVVERLADRVNAELKKRAAGSADAGQGLADWLAAYGVLNKGANFPEVSAVIQLLPEDKLAPIAKALEIA